MGGFYGSIHFRTDAQGEVQPLLDDASKASGRRFLCGPPLNGWVSAYPDGSGQNDRDAAALAERWPGELLYLAVHDDDILIYRYFRAGALVDSYWSLPGYFGEDNRTAQEAEAGAPDTYAHLLRGSVERSRSLLDRGKSNKPILEVDRLVAFTKLLGIVNGVTSYEYLENGERDGILRWKQFVHIPERAPERSAAAEAKARMLRQFKEWEAEGLLLVAKEIPSTYRGTPDRQMTIKVGRREISVDFEQRQELSHPVDPVRVVLGRGGGGIELHSDQSTVSLLAGTRDTMAARACDRTMELFMLAPLLAQRPPGQALSTLLRHVPLERRRVVEDHVRRVLPAAPWEQSDAVHLAQLVSAGADQSEGVTRLALSADGRWLFCATHRGLRIAEWGDVVGAPNGAPVPWRFAHDIPPHELVANPRHGSVYAIAHDAQTDRVLFAGKDGRIRSTSLADGRVENLLDVYERAPVMRMALLDTGVLAVHAQLGFPVIHGKGPKGILYLWNYEAVRKRAEGGGRPLDTPSRRTPWSPSRRTTCPRPSTRSSRHCARLTLDRPRRFASNRWSRTTGPRPRTRNASWSHSWRRALRWARDS
jgi:hypothetical protein